MSTANVPREPTGSKAERFERMIYREFLLEPELYLEAGLSRLPKRLGKLLSCGAKEALDRTAHSPDLEGLDIEQLRDLLTMDAVTAGSDTPESVAEQLQGPEASYDQCVRAALC